MKYNVIDSRSVTDPANTTFYAIHTATNDGHKYIKQLYERGVRSFVVDEDVAFPGDCSDADVLKVDNVLHELQRRASAKRNSMADTCFIGITGSRGKTVVKEWLNLLLSPGSDRSPRSYNSQLGVPLSVLSLKQNAEYALIEAGVSQSGEMDALEAVIKPNITIITSITDEHSEGFISREEKIIEKLKLAKGSSKIVYHKDCDTQLDDIISKKFEHNTLFAWSEKDKSAFLYVSRIEKLKTYSIIDFHVNGTDYSDIRIPFVSDFEIIDVITAMTAAFSVKKTVDLSVILKFEPVDTRIDVLDGVNNCVLLYDKFTNDIKSIIPALDFTSRRMTKDRGVTMILHIPDSEFMKQLETDEEYNAAISSIGCKCLYVKSVDDFINKYSEKDFSNEVILIKGSVSSGFDKIVSLLENKQHETVMEVNLDNVVHNYNFFRSKLKPETGLICMLKAAGYGTGSLQLAKTLQLQGAAAIAVAVIDEGIELRKAGITMPIIVLNPRADNLKLMFENNLEPEVYNTDIMSKIIAVADACGIKGYPIHLKLDTGMHRLGFEEYNIGDAIAMLVNQDNIKISTAFSHLATADCFDMNDYTQHQLDTFEKLVAILKNNIPYDFKCHILNTAGILRYPQYQHDFARLGIGLYGISILNDGSEAELRPVASLYSTIIAISDRNPGDTIGYSRKGKITRPSKIATVPIGYADGLDRHLGNGNAKFYVNGVLCPVIGNICMDICMIDVTDCECKVGDRVEIFGPHIPVTRLSDTLGTIPYEILTSISERVKRIYYRE